MQGVTTAIVGFILVCVVFPKLIRNKPQFYMAFVLVLLIILLQSLALMIGSTGFNVFAGVFTGIFQIAALVLLMLKCRGSTLGELTADLTDAYEVIRRGETEKEVIVPIRGEMPKPKPKPNPPDQSSVPLEGGG